MKKIIEVSNVTKSFGDLKALNNVSFDIYSNQVNTIIGKNGAGKTTLLKIMLSLLDSDSGKVTFFENINLKEVSYLSEERGLYINKTGYDNLKYFCYISNITSKVEIEKNIKEVSDLLNLEDILHRKVKTLSKGNAQKIQLATAFVTNSKVIILDEPFSGLDIIKQQEMSSMIQKMSQKRTIIVCTHSIDFIENFAQNVLLIKDGKNVFAGDIKNLVSSEKFIFVNDEKVVDQDLKTLIDQNVEFEFRHEHVKNKVIELIGGSHDK